MTRVGASEDNADRKGDAEGLSGRRKTVKVNRAWMLGWLWQGFYCLHSEQEIQKYAATVYSQHDYN